MKICHLADIHIRLLKREEEYFYVFQQLEKSLIKERPDRIVVCGDIVHSKASLSPECVDLTVDFLERLSDIAWVDVILGNHDLILTNKKRLDSITPIIRSMGFPGISLYYNSEIIKVENKLKYGIFSITDRQNYPINFERDKETTYIALYHGMIKGARFDNEYISKSADNDINVFRNYDIAMLGDIHKRQELRKNILYPGSLVQQSFAEEIEKGYILWDIDLDNKKYSHKFIKIHNKWGFHTIDLSKNKSIPDIEVSEIPRIRVIVDNFTFSELKEINEKIREKWPNVDDIVTKNKETEEQKIIVKDNLDISNIETINDTITNYLNEKNVSNDKIKKITQINSDIYSKLPEYFTIKNSIWYLDKLELSNYFSYGKDNEINLENVKGIVGLFAPNRSGKSSIISTILHVITGKNDKFKKGYDIINNKENEATACVYIRQNEFRYKIERKIEKGLKNKSSKTKLILYKLENDEWIDLNETIKTDTDKLLRKMFGSYEDLTLTSFGLQGKLSNFIEGSTGESYRIKILSKFLGLDIFEEMFQIVKRETAEIETAIKVYADVDFSQQLVTSKKKIEYACKDLDEIKQDINIVEDNISLIEKEVIELKSKIGYDEFDFNIDDKIVEAKDNIETKTQYITEQQGNIKNYIHKLDVINKEIEGKSEEFLKIQIKNLEEQNDILYEKKSLLDSLRLVFDKDNDQVNILKKQEWCNHTELCRNCEFYLESKRVLLQLDNNHREINLLEDYVNENIHYEKDLNNKKEELNRLINILKLKRNIEFEKINCENKIQLYENTIENSKNKLEELEELKQKSLSKFEDAKKLVQLTSNLAKLKNNLKSKNDEVIEIMSNLKNEEENVKKYNESIEKLELLEQNYETYKIYKEAVSKDGIPYYMLSKSIDVINNQINEILSHFVNFRIRIETDEEDKDLTINIVYEDGHDAPIEGASGMEKTISAIAIRAALVKISNLSKCNIFVLDEFASSLDPKYISSIDSMLNYLKNMFDILLLVSHSQEIQDMADTQINISKERGYSKVYVA
jgi:exonuclease SbcC